MNRAIGIASTAGLLLTLVNAGNALANPSKADSFAIEAPVVNVEPLVRVVQVTVPQEVCWEEPVRYQTRNGYQSHTPKVIGGIIGGVVGNQFGKGSGNTVMTAAGALLGASIGRDVAYERSRNQATQVRYERVCEIEQVTHQEERSDGYRVTYEYAGQEFVTYSKVDPGPYIRVRVRLEPLAYNGASDIQPAYDRRPATRKRYRS